MEENQITDPGAFDDLLNNLNLDGDTEPGTEPNVEQGTEPGTEPASTTQTDPAPTEPAGTEGDANTGISNKPVNKQNQAFTQMRLANKAYEQALSKALALSGIDASLAKNPGEVLNILNQADTAVQAKDMNVPPELLQRLQTLEAENERHRLATLQQQTMQGFTTVKEQYKLTDDELQTFAAQLIENNVNPFENPVDLLKEYKVLNMDKIIAKETQRAVQEALATQGRAQQHSTKPTTVAGKPAAGTGEAEVNTMDKFNDLLRRI